MADSSRPYTKQMQLVIFTVCLLGLRYICDMEPPCDSWRCRRQTSVHFWLKRKWPPRVFGKPCYIWFRCPWPHIYVTDGGRNEEGTFKTTTRPRIPQPTLLLLAMDQLLITSLFYCNTVLHGVHLYGELVQEVDWRMDLEDVVFLAHDTCATSPCMD